MGTVDFLKSFDFVDHIVMQTWFAEALLMFAFAHEDLQSFVLWFDDFAIANFTQFFAFWTFEHIWDLALYCDPNFGLFQVVFLALSLAGSVFASFVPEGTLQYIGYSLATPQNHGKSILGVRLYLLLRYFHFNSLNNLAIGYTYHLFELHI